VQRTTRKVALTEAGATFCLRTQHLLGDLADAEAEIQSTILRPRGVLRVSAPVVFGQLYVAPVLDRLLERFPELSVDLNLLDRFVDLIDEGIDLAIRIGALADSRLTARRLCTNRRILVASPEYIAKHGAPKCPEDLASHECIRFTGFARPREWRLLGPNGQTTVVNINGRVATNNVEVLTATAKTGIGVTFGATLSAGPSLFSGELVRVLEEYELEPTGIFAVYPSARQLSTKVRAAVDFLASNLRDPPAWDSALIGRVPGFGPAAVSARTEQ
jgi:DNA-binding transcriptional LysR family regulator